MSKVELLTQEKIDQIKQDAWLGIYVNEKTLYNPLENIPDQYHENPHLFFTYLMSRPEYFQFICKEILNMEIFPFQSVILREMWSHKFPMLVASRGASKCVTYDTRIFTRDGIKKIGDVIGDSVVGERVYFDKLETYTEKGWKEVEYGWNNGETETVIIELENGMSIESTLNHPLRVKAGTRRKWKDAGDITLEDELILEAPDGWFTENKYSKEYIDLLVQLDNLKNEVPESLFSMSKDDILNYIDRLLNYQRVYKTLFKSKARDLQLLYFYACGCNAVITKQETGYSVKFTRDKIKLCKVKSITKSRNVTYDIHLYKNHSFLSNGMVSHNSFTLALYALLRAILIPGRKVIIVGSVFRQSKVIFNYLTKMYNDAPLLRDANNNISPKLYPDRCELQIGDSLITALPIGCLSKDTLVTTNQGIFEMGDFLESNYPNKIWSVDSYKDVGFFFDNGISDTKKIVTSQGYEYIGTNNHKMKVVRNNQIVWCRTDEMRVGDYVLIDKSERWFEPSFNATEDEGYALGCMIGDGSYVYNDRLQFTTIDPEFIDNLSSIGEFKKKKNEDKYFIYSKQLVKDWLFYWDMDKSYAKNKRLPKNLLKSKKSVVANCIAGLIDTDGHIFSHSDEEGVSLTINYTTISEKLAKQIQYILLHFGIRSSLRSRDRSIKIRGKYVNCQTCYELMISGEDVLKFYREIPLRLKRKKVKLENAIKNKNRFVSLKKNIIPVSKELLIEIASKHNLGHRLHVKDLQRKKTVTKTLLHKFINKCNELNIQHENINILQNFINNNFFYDVIKSIEDTGYLHTVDLNVPLDNTYTANGFVSHNTGQSIRGYRSNDTICDEFAAQSQEIFETVIAGFGSVSQSPIANAKEKAAIQFLRTINEPVDDSITDEFNKDNQIILTGSAYYYFNHFAQYWERWRSIIYSAGKDDKLYEVFKGDIPEGFNWKDYSILRLPVELLPPGFMDAGQIARSKATMTASIFQIEFSAVFSKDSDGFFKASSIENATANIDNNITFSSSKEPVIFDPKVKGDPNKRYVMGVDPASEVDNFSIVIIELNSDHNKIVYCWTTNSKKFKKKLQKGLISNKDYYGFCARKIRDLMKDFNIVHIAMDAQGGGKAVYEAFQDDKNLNEGELPLLEIIESGKKKDSDGMAGLHIVEMVQFSNYEYISSANHNLKKDIEDKLLLFPRYSVANLAIQSMDTDEDLEDTSIYDTLEDCIIEIQELKFELAQIVVTVTPSGRERWDTPEVKISGNKKGRARKDRYSSLLISNAAARKLFRGDIETTMYNKIEDSQTNNGFIGPAWATKQLEDLYS